MSKDAPSGGVPVIDGGTVVRTRIGVVVGAVLVIFGAGVWATNLQSRLSALEMRMETVGADVKDIRNVLIHAPTSAK